MLTQNSLKKEAAALTLLAVATCLISCTSKASAGLSPVLLDPGALVNGGFDGGFDDGYALGQRNGGILVNRLKQRTTDLQGCGAIDQLQDAVVRVSRTVRPSVSSDSLLVAGFYSGYLDSIRGTLAQVRSDCGILGYSNGDFAGALFGAVACQTESINIDALTSLAIKPLYSGWSGGSDAVQSSCRATLNGTIQNCSNGVGISTQLNAALLVSCSDT